MKIDYSKALDKIKFWKEIVENAKDFTGSSPPSLFVGRAFYPKVYVGILSPPQHKVDAEVLDFPEKWYQQRATIEQILDYRGQMIYSRFKSPVANPKGKLVEVAQEVSTAKKPVDVEIQLKKNPQFKFTFDNWFAPVGNPAPILEAKLAENPRIERRVDYIVSDVDLKAQNAVSDLYKYHIPVSRIQKIFSSGSVGLPMQRKLVPTRWSITAVDDILGKLLMEEVKNFQEIGEYMLFSNEYLANHFEVLLIPHSYQYEFIEAWDVDKPNPFIGSDFEPYWGRKTYASGTAGAFYAARLAVMEYLEKIKRQAAVLIVREVKPEYYAPVGVWEIRENVRGALAKPAEKFDSIGKALQRIYSRMLIRDKWTSKSNLLKNLKEQKRIKEFFSKNKG